MSVSINPTVTGGAAQGSPENNATSLAAVMTNGMTLFTAVGDVEILNLFSECITPNDATASTLQYSITPTSGAAATISGATATLASATAGTIVVMVGDALTTAPVITAAGVGLATATRGIIFKTGILTAVIGVGSTTGTWRHYLRYRPLEAGAYVY